MGHQVIRSRHEYDPGAQRPAWSSLWQACALVGRGKTLRTALPVAAVVGTVLSIVNVGNVIIDGRPSVETWLKVGANYFIPFCVASTGYLSACRVRATDLDTAESDANLE